MLLDDHSLRQQAIGKTCNKYNSACFKKIVAFRTPRITCFSKQKFWIFEHESTCIFYARAKNLDEQILPFCILVKQYQVYRVGYYHVAYNENRWRVKIF